MKKIEISADDLVKNLLALTDRFQVSILDSCGVNYLESRYLIAGIAPLETFYLTNEDPQTMLDFLDKKLANEKLFHIFTISYDFGLKFEKIKCEKSNSLEPDIFLAVYDVLIIHDHSNGETFLIGNEKKFDEISTQVRTAGGWGGGV